jgi:tetratricopeptide (TPR) repeat protein
MEQLMSNEAILQNYFQTLLNCYGREAAASEVENMNIIAEALLVLDDKLHPYSETISEKLTSYFRNHEDTAVRESITNLLTQFRDKLSFDPTLQLPFERSLAECSELAINQSVKSEELLPQLDHAAEAFKSYADHIEGEGELAEAYSDKYVNTLRDKAKLQFEQGQYDAALSSYSLAYETSNLPEDICMMAVIEVELGSYDEAIQHFQIMSDIVFSGQELSLYIAALTSLAKMVDELISSDSRRQTITAIMQTFIKTALDNYAGFINDLDTLKEFKHFIDIAGADDVITYLLEEINRRMAPQEEQRIAIIKKEEDRISNLKKQIEGKGRSSEMQLQILLNALETEKDNHEIQALAQTAIRKWIESVVTVDESRVYIRNEPGLVQLAKMGNLLSTLYLARHYEHKNNIIGALSLYARIVMLPGNDDDDETIKRYARRCLDGWASQVGRGLTKLLSKQQIYNEYAKDLVDVVSTARGVVDPDSVIETALHEKPVGTNGTSSYNNYILGIGETLGIKEELKPIYKRSKKSDDSI